MEELKIPQRFPCSHNQNFTIKNTEEYRSVDLFHLLKYLRGTSVPSKIPQDTKSPCPFSEYHKNKQKYKYMYRSFDVGLFRRLMTWGILSLLRFPVVERPRPGNYFTYESHKKQVHVYCIDPLTWVFFADWGQGEFCPYWDSPWWKGPALAIISNHNSGTNFKVSFSLA